MLLLHHGQNNRCNREKTKQQELEKPNTKYQQFSSSETVKSFCDSTARTGLLLLGGGATALKNLELDEAQRHEAQREAGHNPGEEHKQTRHPNVDEPPGRRERDVVSLENDFVRRPQHGRS